MRHRFQYAIGLAFCIAIVTIMAAGKPLWAAGEGEMCHGIAGIKCDNGLWCEHDANSCNVADAAGICVKVPDPCPMELVQSCGCDGKTYPGDCKRQKAGVQKKKSGPC